LPHPARRDLCLVAVASRNATSEVERGGTDEVMEDRETAVMAARGEHHGKATTAAARGEPRGTTTTAARDAISGDQDVTSTTVGSAENVSKSFARGEHHGTAMMWRREVRFRGTKT